MGENKEDNEKKEEEIKEEETKGGEKKEDLKKDEEEEEEEENEDKNKEDEGAEKEMINEESQDNNILTSIDELIKSNNKIQSSVFNIIKRSGEKIYDKIDPHNFDKNIRIK